MPPHAKEGVGDDVGARICQCAAVLVGVPFRLHGRRAESGVDCVGLALLSVTGAGVKVPALPPYALRAGPAPDLERWMRSAGFRRGEGRALGDIMIVMVDAMQPHLLIDAGDSIVHAHAGIGRVVRGPMPEDWRELSRWRAPDPTA